MFEKFACRVGIHDFEIIDRRNKGDLIYFMETETFDNDKFKKLFTTDVLIKRVCLRCQLVEDEISDFAKDYIQSRNLTEQRRRYAMEIYNQKKVMYGR